MITSWDLGNIITSHAIITLVKSVEKVLDTGK